MRILMAAIIFLLSYLVGSFPSGYLIGRFNGIDIRKYGSKNIGATNVRRILGRDWSVLCFILDFLKGLIPVLVFGKAMGSHCAVGAEYGALLAGIGSICGHIFPVWLRFKGGKGVATSLGVVAGMAFLPLLIGGLTWLAIFHFKRIVSLASIGAVIAVTVIAAFFQLIHWHAPGWSCVMLFAVLTGMVIFRHKDNIERLRLGTENVFKKPEPNQDEK